MQVDQLVEQFPVAYHMAHYNALDGIVKNGLLSTSAILDLYEVRDPQRTAIESSRRPEFVHLYHPIHGTAVIRDNKPLTDQGLSKCLSDMSTTDYYRLLNSQVFFWLSSDRLERLLGARAYRKDPQLVLSIDTARLISLYEDRIRLTSINSGSTLFNPVPRGPSTFLRIDEYDYLHWRQRRSAQDAVVELAVSYSVPNITELILRAETRSPDGSSTVHWTK